jgi:alpha-glucuronidase
MASAEDGYRLWLRYQPVADERRLAEYRSGLTEIVAGPGSPALDAAKGELALGLSGLLGRPCRIAPATSTAAASGAVLAGTPRQSPAIAALGLADDLAKAGADGFVVRRMSVAGNSLTVVVANRDVGVLHGAFALLRHLQTHRPLADLDILGIPRLPLRMLDHWDNLDRTVERGYAGASIWDWQKLPGIVSPQIEDYARANASIGINAVALTNVNADARVLTAEYLTKVAALATVLRRYGIVVYLTARFSAPIQIGGLGTADPLDADVVRWWRDKCREIYHHVPDFGGFLVKANSEGQPGPQDYGRTHADGANLLAHALAEAGGPGSVLWRAFVYRESGAEDRAKQAFNDLKPLDGKFHENVAIQIKNGPIDFQPREPFHPLFGAMPKTPALVEFQITQEYLGQGTHLAYLAPLYKETLDADTFAHGAGWQVAKVIRGMAGVANIGTDRNWCGHPFAAANWFAFGRLAWDPTLGASEIADDWLRMTFTNDQRFVAPARALMLASREAVVSYMAPLGLHHLMAKDHHHGPGPWVDAKDTGRADWSAVYYHRADAAGIGFDRSPTGSNAVAQYHPPWPEIFGDVSKCPEELLLWFHHVPWTYRMKSGRTLWDELGLRYQSGLESVRHMRATWDTLAAFIDPARFGDVKMLLAIQEQEARWWHDACLLYFQTFSKRRFPEGCQAPAGRLADYRLLKHSYVPDGSWPDRAR